MASSELNPNRLATDAGLNDEQSPPAPPSLIRQLLAHRLEQLEADIREAERGVAEAEELQAQTIRREAAKKARLVDRNALIDAEIQVNVARQLVVGKQKLLKAEQRHQQTEAVRSQVARFERAQAAAATAGDWAALWERCIPLVERAARSYIRAWKTILKARQEWEQPHVTMAAALERVGLPPQSMPPCDVGRNFQETWLQATKTVTAEAARNGQPETDWSRSFFVGGRIG